LSVFNRFLDRHNDSRSAEDTPSYAAPRIPRHSGGWAALRNRLQLEPGLRVIDMGVTSPANINFLAGMGHSIFLADPVGEAIAGNWQTGSDPDGNPIWNVDGFLDQTLNFRERTFDIVLLWTSLDYLPEPFVAPVVERLHRAMNSGGQVLAFFHTKAQSDDTAYARFHLTESDDVEMQSLPAVSIQRAFTNRSIERLFSGWSGFRQFLAKDGVSEVIITR